MRSSQFVFLLLLVCSVQIAEEYATQLVAEAVQNRASARASAASTLRQTPSLPAASIDSLQSHVSGIAAAMRLDPASHAAYRVTWTVRRPARESSAVVSFTGFLRA